MDRWLLCPAPGPKGSQWVQAPKWAQQPLGPKPRHFLPRLLLSGHIPLLISTSSFFSIIDTDVNVTVPRTSPNHSPNRNHHLKSLHTANRHISALVFSPKLLSSFISSNSPTRPVCAKQDIHHTFPSSCFLLLFSGHSPLTPILTSISTC